MFPQGFGRLPPGRAASGPLLSVGLVVALTAGACSSGNPGAGERRDCVPVVGGNGETTGKCLPVAPAAKRVDRGTPAFSDPLKVTNPLHPTSEVSQVIMGGRVDGAPFRTEVTRLPDVKTITWKGHQIKAVTSQYLAFSNGRIHEVALDWYAQSDDGSVWYLGEDVFNYKAGKVADTEGTWVTGDKAPAAMIMPASPKVGDVYRPENVPGVVFEEVTVKSVSETVTGPSGPVKGAVVVEELHMDGSREKKTFAPGYGEFATGNPAGDLEAVSLALPTDAANGKVPGELNTLGTLTDKAAGAVASGDWAAASNASRALTRAWAEFQPGDAPLKLLRTQTDRDIDAYAKAVAGRDADAARGAILRVAQDQLDLVSRYQPVTTTDQARMHLWADQLGRDAAARDTAAVAGDVATLEWTFDRVRHTAADPEPVDDALADLRTAVKSGDLAAAGTGAEKLSSLLR